MQNCSRTLEDKELLGVFFEHHHLYSLHMLIHIFIPHITLYLFFCSLKQSLPFHWPLATMLLQASASLNVTSHLWLRPVLLIAWQLKCEGSKREDKYKSTQAGKLSQTKARSSPSLSSLSSPLTSKVKKRKEKTNLLFLFFIITFSVLSIRCMTLEAFLFARTHAQY